MSVGLSTDRSRTASAPSTLAVAPTLRPTSTGTIPVRPSVMASPRAPDVPDPDETRVSPCSSAVKARFHLVQHRADHHDQLMPTGIAYRDRLNRPAAAFYLETRTSARGCRPHHYGARGGDRHDRPPRTPERPRAPRP